jgi:hypothetical protein
MLRTRVALALALALAAPAAAQSTAPDTVSLENARLRLAFSGKDGRLLQVTDRAGARPFLAPGGDASGVWALELYDGVQVVTPAAARRFSWSRLPGRVPALRLVWSELALPAAPQLRVIATVSLAPGAPDSEWRIALENLGSLPVERVRYPRIAWIAPIARQGGRDALAVPRWMGALAHDARALLLDPATGKGRRMEWPYPGTMSFQAVALYADGPQGGPGLYFAADDTLAYRKDFAVWGAGAQPSGGANDRDSVGVPAGAGPTVGGPSAPPAGFEPVAGAPSSPRAAVLGYEMSTLVENPRTPRARWVMPYAGVVGTFTGDWMTVAERYRDWGSRQVWARNARLTNGRVPAWLTGTAMWIWNRGRSPGVVPPALALQQALGLPVSIYWHWWHHGPYDTSFPDYLPPREGVDSFRAAVAAAHAAGVHAMVYMNQRLWCTGTPSWAATGAARWAVKEKDGQVREEVYNVFDPQKCATMDVTTPFWRAKYVGMADTVVHQYGIDGVYMDQAVQSLVCWDTTHTHPVGGGNYWMIGWRQLERGIRERLADAPGRMLAGEGAGETWLPNLDLMLTLQVSQERYSDPGSGWDPIPFWQAVYHAFGLTYGNYSSLSMPPYDDLWPAATAPREPLALLDTRFRSQFYLEQARAFVWGLQPTIANFLPRQLEERPQETAYMLRLARLRARLPQYFIRGTFLRPPALKVEEVQVELSRISVYAAQLGGPRTSTARFPAAIAGAWRAPDGGVAIAVASIVDRPQTVTLALSPRAYGVAGSGSVVRIEEKQETTVARFSGASVPLSLELPAGGAAVLELRRAGAAAPTAATAPQRRP